MIEIVDASWAAGVRTGRALRHGLRHAVKACQRVLTTALRAVVLAVQAAAAWTASWVHGPFGALMLVGLVATSPLAVVLTATLVASFIAGEYVGRTLGSVYYYYYRPRRVSGEPETP